MPSDGTNPKYQELHIRALELLEEFLGEPKILDRPLGSGQQEVAVWFNGHVLELISRHPDKQQEIRQELRRLNNTLEDMLAMGWV